MRHAVGHTCFLLGQNKQNSPWVLKSSSRKCWLHIRVSRDGTLTILHKDIHWILSKWFFGKKWSDTPKAKFFPHPSRAQLRLPFRWTVIGRLRLGIAPFFRHFLPVTGNRFYNANNPRDPKSTAIILINTITYMSKKYRRWKNVDSKWSYNLRHVFRFCKLTASSLVILGSLGIRTLCEFFLHILERSKTFCLC